MSTQQDTTYNGWSNRDTWAMNLNLSNDYATYQACESAARTAAIGNGPDDELPDPDEPGETIGRDATARVEDFHAELAGRLERLGRAFASEGMLPDFDPDGHESPDPKDPHGPDDIDGVNWQEIAEAYDLAEYL